MKRKEGQWRIIFLTVGLFLPIAVFFASLCLGKYPLNLVEVINFLLNPLQLDKNISNSYLVFWHIRFPRALMVLIAGGSLALAGALFQSVFKNPLVSPDILGVSSGASLGAALAIVIWNSNPKIVQFSAFAGGLLTVFIALNLAKIARKDSIIGLILAGIILNSLASSGVMLLKYLADPFQQLPALEFWIMGGFYAVDWLKVMNIIPIFMVSIIIILLLRWQINVLSLGDEDAYSLGVRVVMLRSFLVVVATILVAAVVSVAGVVSWIGLVAPHIVRMMVGNDNTKILPLAVSVGAVVLLIADTIARNITTSEIPISILTSLVGAPFLAYLLWKVRNGYWNRR